ncbi:unnamed protein product [Heterobilharzia americana]|nr:unnamed protein product [Heterobilharzia americana]
MNNEEVEEFFMDPIVAAHIESFMDAHCTIFTYEKEIHSEHYARHDEYLAMMRRLLTGSSVNYKLIQNSSNTLIMDEHHFLNPISYIIASWNFDLFYQIMSLVNIDLQMEALCYIQQKNKNDQRPSCSIPCPMGNSTEINESEIKIMLLEKSKQKDEVIKGMKQTIQNDVHNKSQAVNTGPKHFPSTPQESNNTESIPKNETQTLDKNELNDYHFNQWYPHKISPPTREELTEKQEFLRKQRDLLIEIRRKKREQLFPDQLKSSTDNSPRVSEMVHIDSHPVDKNYEELMQKRLKLYEKLKIEVINKNYIDTIDSTPSDLSCPSMRNGI